MLVRCDSCHGMKEVMKAGMLRGFCDKCKGIGEIKETDLADYKPVEEEVNVEVKKDFEKSVPEGKGKKSNKNVSIVES